MGHDCHPYKLFLRLIYKNIFTRMQSYRCPYEAVNSSIRKVGHIRQFGPRSVKMMFASDGMVR